MSRIEIVNESVVFQKTDAIVNAANSTLMGGGGVDGAIHDAAGDRLYWYFSDLGCTCQPGEAIESPGFNLPAKHIIHTVGPIWHGGSKDEPNILANCYRNSLDEAIKHECRSISFCCISVGVYGYPLEPATRIALRAVEDWLTHHTEDILVRFCCYSEEEYETYTGMAKELAIQVPLECRPASGNTHMSDSECLTAQDLNGDLCRFIHVLESIKNYSVASVSRRFQYLMQERFAGHVIARLEELEEKVAFLKYFFMKGVAAIPGARMVPGWTQQKANKTKPPIDYHKYLKRYGADINKRCSEEEKEVCWNILSRLSEPQWGQDKVKEEARKDVYSELGLSPEARLVRYVFGEDPNKVTLVWDEKGRCWKYCKAKQPSDSTREDEDATFIETALREEEENPPPPIFMTDGIRLSKRMLAKIAANPSEYLESREGPPQSEG